MSFTAIPECSSKFLPPGLCYDLAPTWNTTSPFSPLLAQSADEKDKRIILNGLQNKVEGQSYYMAWVKSGAMTTRRRQTGRKRPHPWPPGQCSSNCTNAQSLLKQNVVKHRTFMNLRGLKILPWKMLPWETNKNPAIWKDKCKYSPLRH